MSILELKSLQELKATNSPLSNQQLTGISEQVIDKQEDNPLFKATVPEFLFRPPFGTPRNIHAPFLREISKNPYIFSIIKTLQDEAANTGWDIVAKEGYEITPEDEKDRQFIKNFFLNPNSDNESFQQIIRKLIWDISVLDSGVIVKVYNKLQELLQIRVVDGASINKNPDIHGSLAGRADYVPLSRTFQVAGENVNSKEYKQLETQFRNQNDNIAAYYQFSTTVMNSTPIAFGKKELVYIMQHPNSAGVYSVTSPVQAAVDIVLSLIFGAKYHLDYFMNGNGPEGIISLPGASQMQTDVFKNKLNATIMTGKDQFGIQRRVGHRLPVIGTPVDFKPLTFPSKDMEIIEQQQWFTKILWMQFGVTAVEMGFSEDSNQATDKNQSKISFRRGVKPILDNIAYHLNTQIIPELDKNNMFEFKWDESDINEEISKRSLQEKEINMGLKSWQMIAEEEGLDINRLKKDKEENQEQMQEFSFSEEPSQDNSGQDLNKKPDSNEVDRMDKDINLEAKAKYIKRTGSPGNYEYTYADDKKTGGNKEGEESKEDNKERLDKHKTKEAGRKRLKEQGQKYLKEGENEIGDLGANLIDIGTDLFNNDIKRAKETYNDMDNFDKEKFIEAFTNNGKDKKAIDYLSSEFGIDKESIKRTLEIKSTTTDSGVQGTTDTPLVPVETEDKKKKKKKKVLNTDVPCSDKPETKAKDVPLDDLLEEISKEIDAVGEELVKKTKEK